MSFFSYFSCSGRAEMGAQTLINSAQWINSLISYSIQGVSFLPPFPYCPVSLLAVCSFHLNSFFWYQDLYGRGEMIKPFGFELRAQSLVSAGPRDLLLILSENNKPRKLCKISQNRNHLFSGSSGLCSLLGMWWRVQEPQEPRNLTVMSLMVQPQLAKQ